MSEEILVNMDDLMDALSQLEGQEEEIQPTAEEIASQKRYEEIIRKHKND